MATPKYYDRPNILWDTKICLDSLSKDVTGTLAETEMKAERCATPPCATTKTRALLEIEIASNGCDRARDLDGLLTVRPIVTAVDTKKPTRGLHAGQFEWTTKKGIVVRGRMSGVTNAGLFRGKEPCLVPDLLYGRFYGVVVRTPEPVSSLNGWQVLATYRLALTVETKGSPGKRRYTVDGAIEGARIVECAAK